MNTKRIMSGLLAVIVGTAVLGHGAAAVAQPVNPLAEPAKPANPLAAPAQGVNPLAAPAGAALPAWMKPGARVTYISGSATVKDNPAVLIPDGKGNWKTMNGRVLGPADMGSGGNGFNEFTLVATEGNQTAADMRMFVITDPQTNACSYTMGMKAVGNADNLQDLWVHPAKLAALQQGANGNTRTTRMKYPLNGKEFDAVHIEYSDDRSYMGKTYDLESGLLLAQRNSNVLDVGGFGQKSAQLGTVILAGVRQTDLPWAADDFAGFAGGRTLKYTGTTTTVVPNGQPISQGLTVTAEFDKAANGWAPAKVTSRIYTFPNVPPLEAAQERAGSARWTTPYWIAPQTLGRLRQGQVVDDDPQTKFRTVVAQTNADTTTLREDGHTDTIVATYNNQTGVMIGFTQITRNGVGEIRVDLRLAQ